MTRQTDWYLLHTCSSVGNIKHVENVAILWQISLILPEKRCAQFSVVCLTMFFFLINICIVSMTTTLTNDFVTYTIHIITAHGDGASSLVSLTGGQVSKFTLLNQRRVIMQQELACID